MRDKKISKNKKIDEWLEISRRFMELKSKQNNLTNSSDADTTNAKKWLGKIKLITKCAE